MKSVIEQINTMNSIFKIDDMQHAGALAQFLPASWDTFINITYRLDHFGKDSVPIISILQFERQLKNEYC